MSFNMLFSRNAEMKGGKTQDKFTIINELARRRGFFWQKERRQEERLALSLLVAGHER
jgi:hypothetical protein